MLQDAVGNIVRGNWYVVGKPGAGGAELVFVAQAGVERMGEPAEVAQQVFSYCLIGNRHALADECPHFDDDHTPGLAPFPPAVIAGVVAKVHEDGQRQPEQGEGCGIHLGEKCRVLGLDQDNERSQEGDQQAAQDNTFGDRPFEREHDTQHVRLVLNDHGRLERAVNRRSCS
ncbi:hypothetical protein D3C79_758020 [compost metagenome]